MGKIASLDATAGSVGGFVTHRARKIHITGKA